MRFHTFRSRLLAGIGLLATATSFGAAEPPAGVESLQLFAASGTANEALVDGVAVRAGVTLRLRVESADDALLTVRLRQGASTQTIVDGERIAGGQVRVIEKASLRAPAAGAVTVEAELRTDPAPVRRSWTLVIPAALKAMPATATAASSVKMQDMSSAAPAAELEARPTQAVLTSIARRRPDEAQSRGGAEAALFRRWSPGVVLVTSGNSLGSGAVINKRERLAITNWHVVGNETTVSVVFKPAGNENPANAQAYRADVVKVDEVSDLALLRISHIPDYVPELQLGDLNSIEVGLDVHAIGHPQGEAWTYTKGLVSQIRTGYEWSGGDGPTHRATVIQTQTPINPGNSGGPLLNDAGAIVGINSFGRTGSQGLNFAVSVVDIRAMLARDGARRTAPAPQPAPAAAPAQTPPGPGPGRGPNVVGGSDGGASGSASGCNPPRSPVDIDKDGRQDGYAIDENCDGRTDSVALDTNSDGRIDAIYYDRNADGRPDLQARDTNGDGQADVWYVDENDDGNFDVVAQDQNGDGKPDSFRKIAG